MWPNTPLLSDSLMISMKFSVKLQCPAGDPVCQELSFPLWELLERGQILTLNRLSRMGSERHVIRCVGRRGGGEVMVIHGGGMKR